MNQINQVRKAIAALITSLGAAALIVADDDGVTQADWFALAALVLGVVLVYLTPNAAEEPDRDFVDGGEADQ